MDLPNEIILHILKLLEKSDLKSARLISKTWSAFAAEFLFNRAYVSAHPKNLGVFNAITQHPLLSKCVKQLRYDTVDFIDIKTEEDYFRYLWLQTGNHLAFSIFKRSQKDLIPDPDINTWLELVANADSGFDVRRPSEFYRFIRRVCKNNGFIDCGYQKFHWVANFQRAHLNSGDFFDDLARGLQKLSNLTLVKMDDQCLFSEAILDDPDKLFLKSPTGSPMARDWNLFHLRPRPWQWGPQDHLTVNGASQGTHGSNHYWMIICALIRSQRSIQAFATGGVSEIPPWVFNKSHMKTLGFYGLDIVALSGLKTLKLRIASCDNEDTSKRFPSIDGLRSLLGSMHHLESLCLDFDADTERKPMFYNYDQVFPPEGQWSQLTSLKLVNFSSSATNFLTLLTRATPNLKELMLDGIELLSGTWEGVLECMMQSMHLSNFLLDEGTELWHCGGDKFLGLDEFSFPEEIENYVVNGGRHPSLLSNQPDCATEEYITEDLRQFYKPSRST